MHSARAATWIALGLFTLAACSRESSSRRPRTELLTPISVVDGLPTAPRALKQRTVHEQPLRVNEPGLRSWCAELKPVESLPGQESVRERKLAGLLVESGDTRSPQQVEAGVRLSPPQLHVSGLYWEASEVSSVALRAFFPDPGRVRLYFRTDVDEASPSGMTFPHENFVDLKVRPGFYQEDWYFDVAGHPAWRGEVHALRIDVMRREQSYVVDSVRAVARDLPLGSSPTVVDGELVDAGLIPLERDDHRESRRAYPAISGEGQLVRLPGGGEQRLFLSYGLPPGARYLDGPVDFRVSVASLPGPFAEEVPLEDLVAHEGDAREVHAAALDPARDAGSWHAATVTLPPARGARVVYLETSGGVRKGRVNGLWGPVRLAAEEQRAAPVSVLLITADTVRADHLSAYGNPEVPTPTVDALAARGFRFVDALATSNATSPSHATILTGLYPKDHRVLGNQALLPEEATSLAEILRAAGYLTVANTSVRHLNADLSGMGQGIDVYLETPQPIAGAPRPGSRDLPPWLRAPQPEWVRPPYRNARLANERLVEVLDGFADEPFFLWTHYYDPHTPYKPEPTFEEAFWSGDQEGPPLAERLALERGEVHPQKLRYRDEEGELHQYTRDELAQNFLADNPYLAFIEGTRDEEYPRAMYRAEIHQLDRDLGILLDELERRGRLENTLIVFTSDHGEALGEREVWYDHMGVYDNTLRVPLILAGPGIPHGESSEPVSLVDLVPTLCELLDLPLNLDEVRGRSLVPHMNGAPLPRQRRWFQYSDNLEAGFQDDTTHFLVSLIRHQRGTFDRVIEPGARELFDRPTDPTLQTDVSTEQVPRADQAEAEVRQWLEDQLLDVDVRKARISGIDAAALRGLGYTGVGDDEED